MKRARLMLIVPLACLFLVVGAATAAAEPVPINGFLGSDWKRWCRSMGRVITSY